MALTEAMLLSSAAVPAENFSEVYAELLQVNPRKRKRNLDAAFEVGILFYLLFTLTFLQQCSIHEIALINMLFRLQVLEPQ